MNVQGIKSIIYAVAEEWEEKDKTLSINEIPLRADFKLTFENDTDEEDTIYLLIKAIAIKDGKEKVLSDGEYYLDDGTYEFNTDGNNLSVEEIALSSCEYLNK